MGPSNYTFRSSHDVVKIREVPEGFTAVLSGHIHRYQVLTEDRIGRALPAPVFYPGSVERTSFAERYEEKGYMTIELAKIKSGSSTIQMWRFHPLPTRYMYQIDIQAEGLSPMTLGSVIRRRISTIPKDSVVKLRICGRPEKAAQALLRASSLRSLIPDTMNISVGIASPRAKR